MKITITDKKKRTGLFYKLTDENGIQFYGYSRLETEKDILENYLKKRENYHKRKNQYRIQYDLKDYIVCEILEQNIASKTLYELENKCHEYICTNYLHKINIINFWNDNKRETYFLDGDF